MRRITCLSFSLCITLSLMVIWGEGVQSWSGRTNHLIPRQRKAYTSCFGKLVIIKPWLKDIKSKSSFFFTFLQIFLRKYCYGILVYVIFFTKVDVTKYYKTTNFKGERKKFFKKLLIYFLCNNIWWENFLFYHKTCFPKKAWVLYILL